jgi:ABC-type lipoprotein export system ATPase subunit
MDKQKLIEEVLRTYDGDIEQFIRDAQAQQTAVVTPKKSVVDMSNKPVVVELQSVSKIYKLGKTKVQAAHDVSIKIHQGEIVALIGRSGSGKSTILNMIGGLDKPTSGSVLVDGQDLKKLSDAKLSRYRGQKIGFVFQFFYLQPFLNLQTNVEVPAMFSSMKRADRHTRSKQFIEAVDLADRLKHLPKELSGGQMQRAAIARALMNQPKILLADEPTGNLDTVNAQAIIDQFEQVRTKFDTTVIIVTHDQKVAERADRVIELRDGAVV